MDTENAQRRISMNTVINTAERPRDQIAALRTAIENAFSRRDLDTALRFSREMDELQLRRFSILFERKAFFSKKND